MDFYEKVKELQISQQDKSRLRAARLQAMWNRICEDEQKSLARNEELIKEFERVEGHMKRLSARTERLRRSRDEYMMFIKEHYPQWMASKEAAKVQAQPPAPSAADQVPNSPQPEVVQPEPMGISSDIPASKIVTNVPAPSIETPRDTSKVIEPVEVASSVALAASIPDIVLPEPSADEIEPEIQPMESPKREAMMQVDAAPLPDQDLEIENEYDVPLPVETVPKDVVADSQTPLISGRPSGLNSPTIRRLAVRDGGEELYIPTLQLGSTDGTGVTVGTGTLSDQMSELLGSVQSSRTPRLQDSLDGSAELAEMKVSAYKQETNEPAPEPMEASLTLDGICHLLKTVADDFSVTFNPESFYRCAQPDPLTRKKIVYHSNSGDSLDHFDPDVMSMVVLEELPLVCQELPGYCMVRDEVLEDISFMVKEIVFRAKLTTDGRQLWDALYDHMRQAIAHGVLSPREMSLMIGPALLQRRSKNQEKIVTVLTSLLQSTNDSQMSDISSSQATSIANSPSKPTVNRPESTVVPKPAQMNPVSPRDKSTSDDDFFDNSTPRYKPDFKLTSSAAYQSMTGSGRFQASGLDDDDDDVEEILAIGPKSTTPTVASTNPKVDSQSALTPRDTDNAPGAPSPVSTLDKKSDVYAAPTTGTLEASGSVHVSSQALKSSAGSLVLKSSGSSIQSTASQAPKVLQRLMSDNEFSDSEISIPVVGTAENKEEKSEVDDFDTFFD